MKDENLTIEDGIITKCNNEATSITIPACVKEITKIDTASYIREFRIQAARRMLTETQLPVAEICMKCGFDSPSYFSRAFKAATDMSPSVYRKTYRGETSSKAIPE